MAFAFSLDAHDSHDGVVTSCVAAVSAAALLALGFLMTRRSAVPQPDAALEGEGKRTFGDQMALEGELSHIWQPVAAMHAAVALYGAAAAAATGCSIWTIPVYYGVGMLAFYAWHLAAHWSQGALNSVHMQHHRDDFGPEDYYGDASGVFQRTFPALTGPPTLLQLMHPQASMTATLAHEGPLAAAMLVILVLGRLLAKTSLAALAFVFVGYAAMGFVGSALHIAFHVRGFQLEPYAWFRELRSLHYVHHLHRKNFAMVNVLYDIVLCSFQADAGDARPLTRVTDPLTGGSEGAPLG